ncbi:nucleotidyltransferase [Paludicola sp. MB14-C6]|uniref:nucleotidyltransferase n=1 Tax=Paludihabitans sp. MB14-C6 TaxID=3070656 RepID=UPI0027DE2EAE|nr:nucleotidyltransferase [Paludicola sp. MB14-C6]WMJ22476.1 nucleotidyltransferase [Paludicola sp. MB14-C6]
MKVAGIIAEYNPFHNGHAYQIEQTKSQGATHVVAVMSGHFVQRGDIASYSKWARAKAALMNGVDLVVELPTIYALSSAQTFAQAGVTILNTLNVDMLSFGSESGDVSLLQQTANFIVEAETSNLMKEHLSRGVSYPKALEQTITILHGKTFAKVIQTANNSLGIEYLRAIQNINPSIEAITVTREQVDHDSKTAGETIASASYLREIMHEKESIKIAQYMPTTAYEILKQEIERGFSPVDRQKLETLLLYQLRTMDKTDFLRLPDVSEGLENRLYQASQKATTLQQFYDMVKTKRYTLARIRRIAYCALLGITKEIQAIPPQYVRVLGCNQKGMEILRRAKKTTTIPIETKFATLKDQNPHALDIDIKATDIFSLVQPNIQPCNLDFTTNTVIIRE